MAIAILSNAATWTILLQPNVRFILIMSANGTGTGINAALAGMKKRKTLNQRSRVLKVVSQERMESRGVQYLLLDDHRTKIIYLSIYLSIICDLLYAGAGRFVCAASDNLTLENNISLPKEIKNILPFELTEYYWYNMFVFSLPPSAQLINPRGCDV